MRLRTGKEQHRASLIKNAYGVIAVAGAALAAAGILHDKGSSPVVTPQVAAEKNVNEYKRIFRRTDSLGKVVMQYKYSVAVGSDVLAPSTKHFFVDHRAENARYVTYFNNACLDSSGYDPRPGPNTPLSLAARVSSNEDYSQITLTPKSVSPEEPELRFEVNSTAAILEPANRVTEKVLESQHCTSGVQSNEIKHVTEMGLPSVGLPGWIEGPLVTPSLSTPPQGSRPGNISSPFFYVK